MPFESLFLGEELRQEIAELRKSSYMLWFFYKEKLTEYEAFCRETDEILTFGEFVHMF